MNETTWTKVCAALEAIEAAVEESTREYGVCDLRTEALIDVKIRLESLAESTSDASY